MALVGKRSAAFRGCFLIGLLRIYRSSFIVVERRCDRHIINPDTFAVSGS
jgi:hypothetical protein